MELTTFWFIIIGVLWTGYFVLEGFDFGVGMLLPVLGKGKAEATGVTDPVTDHIGENERRRRVMLNTIGPVWDGNEVWVLTAGGATFAAFPNWYATLFSGAYLPLLLILVALIVRNMGFEYRHKRDSDGWRRGWDAAIVFGSCLPAILWGVALTNIVHGLPINQDMEYTGNLLTMLNPVSLLGGVTTMLVFMTHGCFFVALKTDGAIRHDARALGTKIGLAAAVAAVVLLLWLGIEGGSVWSWITTVALAVIFLTGLFFNMRGKEGLAFLCTFVAIALFVLTYFLMLFPNVMPSSTNPAWSLTTTNAASSHHTLVIMTWVALIFTPIVLIYQSWTYWVFRKRITTRHIPKAVDPSRPDPIKVH